MEDEEPEETNGNNNRSSGSGGRSSGPGSGRKVPLSRIPRATGAAPVGGDSGSEKITSSSENEVEEIPKDDEELPAAEKPSGQLSQQHQPERANSLQVGPAPAFGRSRTFDGTVQESPPNERGQFQFHQYQQQLHQAFQHQQLQYASSRCRPGLLTLTTRSPHSSSSQEDYEPEVKPLHQSSKHLLLAACPGQVTARSMESLRTPASAPGNYLDPEVDFVEDSRSLESLFSSSESHVTGGSAGNRAHHHHQSHHHQHYQHHHHYRSFLTASKLDVRRIQTLESKSSENLLREDSRLRAEERRGLFASTDRSKLQHLSLPPPNNFISLTSPGGSDRRITILSPHSPISQPDFQQAFAAAQTLKSRRKKAIVLPRLVLAPSESPVFE